MGWLHWLVLKPGRQNSLLSTVNNTGVSVQTCSEGVQAHDCVMRVSDLRREDQEGGVGGGEGRRGGGGG